MKQEIKIMFFGMLTMSLFSLYHLMRHQSMPFALDNNNNNNNNIELLTAPTTRSDAFYDDENDVGIVSKKDPSFFRVLREEIDGLNNRARCKRYGFGYDYDYDERQQPRRRIFFGALVASESWELFEIVAAEAYGLYDGIVLVESNRTHNFTPKNVTWANNNNNSGNGNATDTNTKKTVAHLFGVDADRVQLRLWTNEDGDLRPINREKQQRDDVLQGWRELGMRPDDIAVLGDIDETFTRGFLVALRTCGSIPELDYEQHRCLPEKMGLRAVTQIYESSPECLRSDKKWHHPSMFSGHCIEGIGGDGDGPHKSPPRNNGNLERLKGWGYADWNKSNPYTPLANGGDFRTVGAKKQAQVVVEHKEQQKHFQRHTAYHFHNFFVRSDSIRFKYFTYGHADKNTYKKSLTELANDIAMMVHCVKNMTTTARRKHLPGLRLGSRTSIPLRPSIFGTRHTAPGGTYMSAT